MPRRFCWLWFSSGSCRHWPPKRVTVEEVRVRGNRRITLDDIMFYVQTKKGDPYDENRLRMDWSAINRTNVFEQIELVVG